MIANHASTPKTLACPHCGAQMNLTGRGRAPGSVVYFCSRCVPMLQVKELWLGQVVRTGNLGFGFVQLRGAQALGGVRFLAQDCLDPATGGQATSQPRVGDSVLALLGDDATQVQKLWRLAPAQPRLNGSPSVRRHGVITTLKTPVWGFITEMQTGVSWFVHQKDLAGGGILATGLRVTFLPAHTPKGRKACEVRVVTG